MIKMILIVLLLQGCSTFKDAIINDSINKIHYKKDISDEWKKPSDFYANGGDCEDYAIAKWYKLKKIHPTTNYKLVYVRIPKYGPHMVLVDFSSKNKRTFDNRTPYIMPLFDTGYSPVYAIDKKGLWIYHNGIFKKSIFYKKLKSKTSVFP